MGSRQRCRANEITPKPNLYWTLVRICRLFKAQWTKRPGYWAFEWSSSASENSPAVVSRARRPGGVSPQRSSERLTRGLDGLSRARGVVYPIVRRGAAESMVDRWWMDLGNRDARQAAELARTDLVGHVF